MANGQDIGDVSGLLDRVDLFLENKKQENQLPVFDQQTGAFTGEFYDRRRGAPPDQPSQDRLTAHLEFMRKRHGGRVPLQQGQPLEGFDHIDPFESEGLFDSIGNVLKGAYSNSLTGSVEKFIDSNDQADAFGLFDAEKQKRFQPNFAEGISSEILSFFMPVDLATLFAGGAGFAAKIPKLAGLGYRLAPSVVKGVRALGGGTKAAKVAQAATISGSALGTYDASRAYFEGDKLIPDVEGLKDIAKGFGKGAVFGSVMSMAGGILPSTILEAVPGSVGRKLVQSQIAKGATAGTVEIATFGTLSGVLEGRVPTSDDYAHAAGFILGMKTLGQFSNLSEARKQRKMLGEKKRAREYVDNLAGEAESVARDRSDQFSFGFIEKIRESENGTVVGKLKDFFTGKDAQKVFKDSKAMETDVVVERRQPETAEGDASGWVTEVNGKPTVFINPDITGHEAITLVHEAYHVNRQTRKSAVRKDREPKQGLEQRVISRVTRQTVAEKRKAARLGLGPVGGKVSKKNKSITGGVPTAHGDAISFRKVEERVKPALKATVQNRTFQKKLAANEVVTVQKKDIPNLGGDAQAKLAEIVPKGGSAPVSSVSIITKKTTRSGGELYGPGRSGITVGTQKTKANGGTSQIILDVGATTAEGVRLVDRAREVADSNNKKLYVSKKVQATPIFAEMQKQGMVEKVGARYQVKPKVELVSKETDPDISFRTVINTSKEKGEKLHPIANKLLDQWDKIKPKSFRAAENSFTPKKANEAITGFQKAFPRGIVLTGQFYEMLNELGLNEISPINFAFTKKQKAENARRLVLAEKLTKDIRATDKDGRGPAPRYRKFFNDLLAEVQKVNPEVKQFVGDVRDKGYFTNIGRQSEVNELRDQIATYQPILDKLSKDKDGRPLISEEKYLQSIKNHSEYLGEYVADVKRLNKKVGADTHIALNAIRDRAMHKQLSEPFWAHERGLVMPERFWEQDARIVLTEYAQSVAKYISEAEQFGPKFEKLKAAMEEISLTAPKGEADRFNKLVSQWFKTYEKDSRLSPKARKLVDIYTAWQVATKIGLGGATLLNLGQSLISLIPDLGVYPVLGAGLDILRTTSREATLKKNRQSGAVADAYRHAIEAVAGYNPAGRMGRFADFVTTASGFQGINKGLLHLAAASMNRALPNWHRLAQGKGIRAEHARKRLADFGIDYKKPISERQHLEAMAGFARNSQLQKNILKDPLVFNDERFKALFLFKRFGVRQASYMTGMLRREVLPKSLGGRGNPMPLVRLALGGYLGGVGISWALNTVKEFMSGEPYYSKDDSLLESFIERLSTIGALGVISDIGGVDKLSSIPGTFRFIASPVFVSDAMTILDNMTRFGEDWERYGDGWLATKKNTYRIFDTFGTWPRAASKRLLTPGQKENRAKFKKTKEKGQIMRLIVNGDVEAASNRVVLWQKNNPNIPMQAADFSSKEVLRFLENRAKSFAASVAKKDTREFNEAFRQKFQELKKEFKDQGSQTSNVRRATR